jgi:hypothetical protein
MFGMGVIGLTLLTLGVPVTVDVTNRNGDGEVVQLRLGEIPIGGAFYCGG